MKLQEAAQFRLMTYNVRGGTRDPGAGAGRVREVIRAISPDILAMQEVGEFQDADGVWRGGLREIAPDAESGQHGYFGPTVDMREHLQVQKSLFVHGIFNDWLDWRIGNALLSRWDFVRLGDPLKHGVPRNVSLYRAPLYLGNRDTEPRHVIVARVNRAPVYPFIVGVHLTTLVAEREQVGGPVPFPGKAEQAQLLRFGQARRLLELLKEHVLDAGEVVFLLGDFNAVASEACITSVLEGEAGFVRLVPKDGTKFTHPEVGGPIDHIFVYPGDRLLEYECWIADDLAARGASDHLPVVADVRVI